MQVKEILKKKRKDKNITQEELAKMLHISRGAYAQYETGKNTPTTDVIVKLAEIYECSTDYLLGRYT